MSGMFEQQPRRPQPPPPPGRPGRSRALVITAAVLFVGFIALTAFASFWTERLWFQSVGYSGVFTTKLWTRVGLFLVFGALMAAVVAVNIVVAHRFRPWLQIGMPDQASLERYREALVPVGAWVVAGASLLVGAFAGASASNQWREFTLWRHAVPFNQEDPYFKNDASFYVFDLPWWHYVTDFVMATTVIGLMAAALVHYLYGGIRLSAPPRDRLSGAAQVQLSVLLGVFVLAKAVDYWLDRYDLVHADGGLVTGFTYTSENAVLPAKEILAGIAVICAILFFLNVWRRTWMLPSMGLALLALSAILLGMVWPGVVQQFQVNPTEADKEAPYIAKNIQATRAAYDIDGAEMVPYTQPTDTRGGERLAEDAIDTPGVRLVDPNIIPAAFEQSQQVRGYYAVADVLDVDQYEVEGQPRDLVLGVRELDQAGIDEGSQNWANLHTVYTHGDGIIAAFGNQRPADNSAQTRAGNEEPRWAPPPRGDLTEIVGDYESRIYFGEQSPTYSIVGKPSTDAPDLELDVPLGAGGEETDESGATSTYDGATGVRVGGIFNKLLYAVKFGEANIVLSDRVHDNSRILYDRDPALMVEKVAPWLTVDADPFPAVVDGKIKWILDGYTTTDRFPLSQKESFDEMTDDALEDDNAFQTIPTDKINYIRNAVKATVDAYDGTVTLYEWDEDDPILKAWMEAFPGTVEPRDSIPDALLDHMRYPEDLFKVQRYQLAKYHVEDANRFYQANEQWEVPEDPNSRSSSLQPPYRLSVSTDGEQSRFSLTSTFVPVKRQNLAAYVTVAAEAEDPDTYGKIRILDLTAGTTEQVQGPGQVAARINADETLQRELLSFTSGSDAQVQYGNLLTLPVADRLLYVQPIYTIRETGQGSFPVLQFTAVSFGDDVGFGATFPEAIRDLLGVDEPAPVEPQPEPDGGQGGGSDDPAERVRELLDEAETAYDAAQAALADQDLAEYQRQVDIASEKVAEAIELADQLGTLNQGGRSRR